MSFFEILSNYRAAFVAGLLVTLELALSVWVIGLGVGIPTGVLASRFRTSVGGILAVVSSIFSAVPVLVTLFWVHYPLQAALGVAVNPIYTAVIVLGLTNIVVVSDIMKNALNELPGQFYEAAVVSGLPRGITTRKIVLPLVFRFALPPLLVTQINVLHLTLFTSLISVEELFRVSQRINAMIYRPVEIYTGLAVFFLVVCLPVHLVAQVLRRRYSRSLTER